MTLMLNYIRFVNYMEYSCFIVKNINLYHFLHDFLLALYISYPESMTDLKITEYNKHDAHLYNGKDMHIQIDS